MQQSDPPRPASIDLSLELERQLEAESLPNSPNPPRPQSLDTHVLASIVTQLRLALAKTTSERDTLTDKLAEGQTREDGMREALEHVTDKCVRMENDLELAQNQRKEDEETIAMLRTKVEESRRALMRLQTEKRMSQASNLTLDLSRPLSSHSSLTAPPSSKRASFAPLTLTGSSAGRMNHRRISSMSDSGFLLGGPESWPPPSPVSVHIPEDPETTPTVHAAHNRRMSLLFGRGAVPQPGLPLGDVEVEIFRKQLSTMQQQLDDTKRELVEVQEAHEASELCVRALRTFISENNVGVSAPPRNADSTAAPPPPPPHAKQGSTASRWGFKLWTSTDSDATKGIPPPASTPISNLPPSDLGLVSSVSSIAPPRKIGGFFGTRSTASASSNGPTQPPYEPVHQEPMFNGSDTSSLADSTGPISPASDLHGSNIGALGEKVDLAGAGDLGITTLDHTQESSVPVVA